MIAPKKPKLSARQEQEAYEIVTFRDDDTCQKCLRNCGPINRDHRKNRSQGGLTVPSNLQLLGGSGTTGCHGFVTTHPAQAVREGWACPGWAVPSEWPARRWLRRHSVYRLAWVLLDDDGDWVEITDTEASRRMEGGRSWPRSTGPR